MLNTVHKAPAPRVLVLSLRGILPAISRCMNYEFEDLIAAVDDVDIVTPQASLAPTRMRRRAGRALERISLGLAKGERAALKVDREYDLFFHVCQDISDLVHLGSLAKIHERCKTSVCYIDELWTWNFQYRGGELEKLRAFDAILVGCQGSVEPLQKLIGRPCHFVPAGMDGLRFAPQPPYSKRSIDLYWMGRRSSESHTALQAGAVEQDRFYMHDTFACNRTLDHVDHRILLSRILKRSKFFMAYPAKVNAMGDTGGQEEVGFRFFEGAMSGTVMLGQAPVVSSFDELFGWEDSVIPVPYGSTDIWDVVRELERDPERLEAIRARNVSESLLRHDWVYRWEKALEAAGFENTDRIQHRRQTLEAWATIAPTAMPLAA